MAAAGFQPAPDRVRGFLPSPKSRLKLIFYSMMVEVVRFQWVAVLKTA
jgi:hypothetical protein